MLFKQDCDTAKQSFTAFWEDKPAKSCFFAVTAPRSRPIDLGLEIMEPARHEDRWLDKALILNNSLYEFAHTYYGGMAFPNLWIDLGPGVPAAFMGASHFFGDGSIWYDGEHLLKDWTDADKLAFNYESFMWKKLLELTQYYCANSNGNFRVSITDLGGSLDIAAYFRGTQQLIYDMIDDTGEVKRLVERIDRVWIETFQKTHAVINEYMDGCTDWLNLWCPGTCYAVQCDLAAVLSPSLFEEFALPSLIRQTEFLDRSMFHLHMYDKPAQSAQLDMMLGVKSLTGFAFIAESYDKDSSDDRWFKYYRRIQDEGKRLMIDRFSPAGLEKLVKTLSLDGLYIRTECQTEGKAIDLMEKVEKWSR